MSSLNPISKPQSLRKQVYLTLRESLRNGVFQNNRLVERELAEQLGVSRTPVREALALLESDGILVATGRGFEQNRPSDREIQDIYEIRQLLEPYAVSVVARDLSGATLSILQTHCAAQLQAHAESNGPAFCDANQKFRTCWISNVLNSRLAAAIELYDDHVVFLRKLTLERAVHREATIENLTRLMTTFEQRDAKAARTIMSAHLVKAEQALRAEFKILE